MRSLLQIIIESNIVGTAMLNPDVVLSFNFYAVSRVLNLYHYARVRIYYLHRAWIHFSVNPTTFIRVI